MPSRRASAARDASAALILGSDKRLLVAFEGPRCSRVSSLSRRVRAVLETLGMENNRAITPAPEGTEPPSWI